jgi:hypothetical protein
MEPTCSHKQQNTNKKERKKGSLTFCQDLVMAPTHSQKQQNKKKKGGVGLYRKLVMAPTKTKTKRKRKKKIGCLPLNWCVQTLHSSTSKLSTLQALSSLNPNVQLVGDGMITRGVSGGWVSRMREVDGLVRGRVVRFRV